MARTAQLVRSHHSAIAVAAGWPLARRVGLGAVRFGGTAMSGRMLRGVALADGDRVVDLLPGDGSLGRMVVAARTLHAWTGVCLSRTAGRRVAAAVPGGATVVGAPDRTGLPDGSAGVVLAEGLLTGLSHARKVSVLQETARVLRPEGRAAFHEVCVLEGGFGEPPGREIVDAVGGYADGGLRPLTEAGWRAVVEEAGMTVAGISTAPLEIPEPGALLAGMRARALRALPVLLMPGGHGARARRALEQLTRHRERLAAVVIVAERPLVGPLRGHGAGG